MSLTFAFESAPDFVTDTTKKFVRRSFRILLSVWKSDIFSSFVRALCVADVFILPGAGAV